MAVKANSEESARGDGGARSIGHGGAPSDGHGDGPPGDDVDAALEELLQRIRPVVTALKQSGPPPDELHAAFHDADLGPRHGVVLLTVTLRGELSVSELAESLALSLSTTSLMVGQLSRAGLLERVEDERDRRRTLVRLNESYREQLGAWLIERIGPLRRTLQRLTPDQRAGFLEGWRILEEETASMAKAAGAASPVE
jgi:DNA-binding MarR family transcriptional regulator